MCKLISFVGEDDSDILPFFLGHYRHLGVGAFHIIVHGAWSKAELSPLDSSDVTIEGFSSEPFDAVMKASALQTIAQRFVGEWVIVADADEFLELPYASLSRTIAALECLGSDELQANLLQRAAPDGKLLSLADGEPQALFSSCDYRLAERMNTAFPIWKGKYPLARISPRFRLSRGNHFPSNGRPVAHLPIRGVVNHFKWRDRLMQSIGRTRRGLSNQSEQDAYSRWLGEHDGCLPTDGLKPYSRSALFRDGHLIKPNRTDLGIWSALRRAFDPTPNSREGLSKLGLLKHATGAAAQVDTGATGHLDKRGLLATPGRIALVTTDLMGLRRSGGIGSAMSALAERLAGRGHEVHIFLVPYADFPNWHQFATEYWEARGCQIHHLPMKDYPGLTPQQRSLFVAQQLTAGEWDVIHFADAGGLAAGTLLIRSSGIAFQDTQIVVTAHGPTRWHRQGNLLSWTADEAVNTGLESTSIELADVVVCPSAYMAAWCRHRVERTRGYVVIPNSLIGENRCFGRRSTARRRVDQIVFFGRIEFRKGIEVFLEAIERLFADNMTHFEVVFLGSFDGSFSMQQWAERTENWPCRTRVFRNYTSSEALDLLRSENCIAVMPSRVDNSPYTVYECLENAIPFIATDVGGTAELIHPDDRARALVSGSPEEIAERLVDALQNGAAPVRPSFDPALADIDLLALHGNLVEAARASRGRAVRQAQPATVIVYGPKAEIVAPPLAEWLARVGGASIEVLVCGNADTGPSTLSTRTLNDAARQAAHGHLFFCHTTAFADADALSAMATALVSEGADAAVCGYRVQNDDGPAGDIAAFAGPLESSARTNVYGARLFLVRKAAFLDAGGFSDQPDIVGMLEWEFLNRLKAAGRRIAAVPIALASAGDIAAPTRLTESQQGALTLPWTEATPLHLQGLTRMALHSSPSAQTAPQPSLHATNEPAKASLFRGVDPWDDALNRGGRLRIGPDGALRDATETYRIETAADASDCDFLVVDGLIDADTASLLADVYRDVERHLLCADGAAPAQSSFLWLRELAAKRPDNVCPIRELLEDALARASAFFEIGAVLDPDRVQLRRIGTGGSMLPPRRIAPRAAYRAATNTLGFAGHLFLGAACKGGGLYFTGLDMEVSPQPGRLVSTFDAPYHERAILKVTSGELLTLSFAMRMRSADERALSEVSSGRSTQ